MSEFINIFGFSSDALGIGGALFSLLIWLKMRTEKKFNEQRIKIQLTVPNTTLSFDFPYEIERKFLSRSELQGWVSFFCAAIKT